MVFFFNILFWKSLKRVLLSSFLSLFEIKMFLGVTAIILSILLYICHVIPWLENQIWEMGIVCLTSHVKKIPSLGFHKVVWARSKTCGTWWWLWKWIKLHYRCKEYLTEFCLFLMMMKYTMFDQKWNTKTCTTIWWRYAKLYIYIWKLFHICNHTIIFLHKTVHIIVATNCSYAMSYKRIVLLENSTSPSSG